jgi:hypothetical protein
MVRTSRRGKSALPDALITPPSPEKGLCIDDESNCFDACLNDAMMCEKCKDLIGVNIDAGQSWAALGQKMAAMKSKNHKCQNPWQRAKYIDVKKPRSFLKWRCQMVLDFCKEHGITVKSNKDDHVAVATANTDDMTVSTNAKDMDAYADVTNDSNSDDGKMETDEDVGNKMDADEGTANNDGEDMDPDAGVPKDSGGNDGETEMEMETDEDMEIPGLMNQPTDCWEK